MYLGTLFSEVLNSFIESKYGMTVTTALLETKL